MSRHPREDEVGAWHHVMNRGLARRTIFESGRDIRKFLSLLARAVRAERIQVHAFCVLTTHFHLLVRSPRGELSAALQWVMNQYVRWFNRGRRRDGPLMRGRFLSKRVTSESYCFELVRYIDFNPVEAGLADTPASYPHGSASRYARPSGPPWLDRSWVESVLTEDDPGLAADAAAYARVFGKPLSPTQVRWIEKRNAAPRNARDPLDELLDAAPERVLQWMRRKALLTDGTHAGIPVCDPEVVVRLVNEEEARAGPWRIPPGRGSVSAWGLLRTGLLRELCASTLDEVAQRTGLSRNTVWRLARRHRPLLAGDEQYGAVAARIASRALEEFHARDRALR